MSQYLILGRITEEGREDFDEADAIVDALTWAVDTAGGVVERMWASLGQYDLVLVVDYPDNEAAFRAAALLARVEVVETQTLPLLDLVSFVEMVLEDADLLEDEDEDEEEEEQAAAGEDEEEAVPGETWAEREVVAEAEDILVEADGEATLAEAGGAVPGDDETVAVAEVVPLVPDAGGAKAAGTATTGTDDALSDEPGEEDLLAAVSSDDGPEPMGVVVEDDAETAVEEADADRESGGIS